MFNCGKEFYNVWLDKSAISLILYWCIFRHLMIFRSNNHSDGSSLAHFSIKILFRTKWCSDKWISIVRNEGSKRDLAGIWRNPSPARGAKKQPRTIVESYRGKRIDRWRKRGKIKQTVQLIFHALLEDESKNKTGRR